MKKLMIATHNLSKVIEFKSLLDGYYITSSKDCGIEDVEETGTTYVENAIIKARHCSLKSNQPCLADDSGLEIDYLNHEPGVYSARYAGKGKQSHDNVMKVLTQLRGVPFDKRTARFRCVLVWMRHAMDPAPIIVEGVWEGYIHTEAKGVHGFGYDPIFWSVEHQCTAAELSPDIKRVLSHRAKAKNKLLCVMGA